MARMSYAAALRSWMAEHPGEEVKPIGKDERAMLDLMVRQGQAVVAEPGIYRSLTLAERASRAAKRERRLAVAAVAEIAQRLVPHVTPLARCAWCNTQQPASQRCNHCGAPAG